MARFPEAIARLFHNVFVCKKCKTKVRAQPQKIMQGRIVCRNCGSRAFRPIKSKR